VVDQSTGLILCTAFASGKTHDFKLYKASGVCALRRIKLKLDTGYQGIKKIHANAEHPIKRRKKQNLTKEQKRYNRAISRERVANEHPSVSSSALKSCLCLIETDKNASACVSIF